MAIQTIKQTYQNPQRRFFNPFSKEDVGEYKFFLEKNRWKSTCPFELEWPFLSIKDMIQEKLISSHLDTIVKNTK